MAEVQTIDDLKALVSNKGGVARGNVLAGFRALKQ